jgi:sulfatase modifying factor 1
LASLYPIKKESMRRELESSFYFKVIGVTLVITASCVSESSKTKVKTASSIDRAVTTKRIEVEASAPPLDTTSNFPGMVYFSGGSIKIGAYTGRPIEQPVFETTVPAFWMDKNLVTVKDFRQFIQESGYRTEAENFGNSLVFNFELSQWQLVDGANWEYPLGRNEKAAPDNHPVTQVSYNDAVKYAEWAGKRLPSELEWEYAARNGKNTGEHYPWGNDMVVADHYMANIWQGPITPQPDVKDGFLYTSPVGTFGETPAGLTDMSGNVWQWTSSLFEPYPGAAHNNRAGPDVRVIRGGSFMFDEFGPQSNSVWFRGQNTMDTGLFNMGFRCAR